jgi:hypothetical protein
MSTEGPAVPEQPKNPNHERLERPVEQAGIYHEERRRAERDFILERLRSARVSTKGLDSLRMLMETTASLEDLQRKLEKSEESFDAESFAEIKRIISEIRSLSETDLRRLKEDILRADRDIRTNPSVFVTIDENAYPSHSLDWVKRLEESPLGESLLRDMAGLAVGVADSGYAVLRLLVDLLMDLVRLPADVIRLAR